MQKRCITIGYNDPLPKSLRIVTELSGKPTKVIARKLGISPRTLTKYKNGESIPSVITLIKICKFFNVSADEVLGLAQNEATFVDVNKAYYKGKIDGFEEAMNHLSLMKSEAYSKHNECIR